MKTHTELAVEAVMKKDPKETATMSELLVAAAKQAIKDSQKARKAEYFHDTALLMDNYRILKGYPVHAIENAEQARAAGVPVPGETVLSSIRCNRARTMVMLAHIDAALKRLEEESKRSGQADMFEGFRLHYIDGLTLDQVAERMHTGKNAPGRWCKKMNERLAVLLFGLDGLSRW